MASDDKTKESPGSTGGSDRGGADGKAKAPKPKSKTETTDNRSREVKRKM